jgi:hypothetical protein
MVPRLKLLRTKTRNGIDIPLNAKLTIQGQTLEVWGLAKKKAKCRCVLQWWIVHPLLR